MQLGDVSLLLEWLADRDIHSVGRFGAWEYFNMDHAIASGMSAVRSPSLSSN